MKKGLVRCTGAAHCTHKYAVFCECREWHVPKESCKNPIICMGCRVQCTEEGAPKIRPHSMSKKFKISHETAFRE